VDFETILFEQRGPIALITLNRPEAMNAINLRLSEELEGAVDYAETAPDVKVIVLTGAGNRAFSAGADLKELASDDGTRPVTSRGGFAGFVRRWIVKPVIGAINGFALGGGAELALACDLLIASERASFGLPEVSRGFAAGSAGGLLRLPRLVPIRVAMEMALTGQPIDAREALRIGLVNRVVDPERLLDEAIRLADVIAANAPLAVQGTKAIIYRGLDAPLWGSPTAWDHVLDPLRKVSESEDAREGPRAFTQKRPPIWTGK
jgi:crotonobetainyl-CoA hydratase